MWNLGPRGSAEQEFFKPLLIGQRADSWALGPGPHDGEGATLTTEAATHVPFPGVAFRMIADETEPAAQRGVVPAQPQPGAEEPAGPRRQDEGVGALA